MTIGNFDGFHRGHQHILALAKSLADKHDDKLIAITFDPHPIAILNPGKTPTRLTTIERRIELLKAAGATEVVVLKPTRQLLAESPEQFVQQIVDQYHPIAFVEGADFRFGHERAGDINLLRQLAEQYNFTVHTPDTLNITLTNNHIAPVRSSLIRWLIGQGRVADAAVSLGHPYTLTASVVRGAQMGRKIGFPTINLCNGHTAAFQLPLHGVYAGTATFPHLPDQIFTAAISVGLKPTFENKQKQLFIEAYLLDTDLDLYDKTVHLSFTAWIRDQLAFSSVDDLIAQMHRDVAQVRCFALKNRHEPLAVTALQSQSDSR